MPTYVHECTACKHEWEDIYKMTDPIPTTCPSCSVSGQVRRLISICSGKVELTGREHIQKLYAEGKKLKEDAKNSPNLLANIVGEEKYHKQELIRDKIKKELK